MTEVRALVVDDEAPARRRLTTMLEELDVSVVGEAENGLDALTLVRERHPNVLLLDIAMPEVDGFEVARHLEHPPPLIIFQTAHHEHALRAFDHDAVDYVVKPVALDRLSRALDRARQRLASAVAPPAFDPTMLDRLRSAIDRDQAAAPPRRLIVRDRAAHRLIAVADVVRFSVVDALVFAHTATARFLTDYTMSELETRLARDFVRCSRADLVQIDQVARIASNSDGSAEVTLKDGARVHVSRRRSQEVRRALES
jgi:two-component system LytT family response regulator